jgi:uncharacterized protein DUF3352
MTDFERPTTDPMHDTTDVPVAAHDTTAEPVPTQPITAPEPTTPAPKPSRARWFAAAGLIAIVVGATALITLSLTASSPRSVVLGYVPTDSTMYGELRLDLPGDQRQKVGQFLSKFPGFADQAALDTKLDETLDRLTSQSTDGKQSYTTDIKPWFDGQLGFSIGPIPAARADAPAPVAKDLRALLLVSIKDETLARAWFEKAFSEAGTGITSRSETYGGVPLTLFTDTDRPEVTGAFGILGGKVAILGDATSVKAAVDTKGSSGLAKGPAFEAASNALKGDDVGFVFVDTKALMDASKRMTQSLSSAPPVSDALLAIVPEWVATRVRVEGDALQLDGAFPHVEGAPTATENRTNGVAAFAPPSTVALLSGNDYGATLKKTIALYRQDPALADVFKQIDQAAGLLGGVDAAVGWMGDSGLVISEAGDGVEGGIVSIPADPAGGRQLLTQLRTFVQLGGAQMGITMRDETYNGQTITIVDLGSLRDLAGMAGALGGLPSAGASEGLPDGHAEVAYVATDQVVAIGSSPEFIKHVLDAGSGASLADDARFQSLLGRVDTKHVGVYFLDLASIRGLVEGAMASASAQERAEYEESVKPFLSPFDALIGTGALGSGVDQSHYVITVN